MNKLQEPEHARKKKRSPCNFFSWLLFISQDNLKESQPLTYGSLTRGQQVYVKHQLYKLSQGKEIDKMPNQSLAHQALTKFGERNQGTLK